MGLPPSNALRNAGRFGTLQALLEDLRDVVAGLGTGNVYFEVPTGTIDGANMVFTTSVPYTPGSIRLHYDLSEQPTSVITEDSTTQFTLSFAPTVLIATTNGHFWINFEKL